MRWFGQVYIPMMAVLGLLFIVLSLVSSELETAMYMPTGAILAAGACIGGAIQQGKS